MQRTKNNGISQNINLIRKIAWSYHQTTGIEYDDLFQEACLAWLENKPRWNAQKGRITTFMWYCIQNHLNDYLKDQKRFYSPLKELTTKQDKPVYQKHYFETLPMEAITVAELVLSNPMQYVCCTTENVITTISETMLHDGYNKNTISVGIKYLQHQFKKRRKTRAKAKPLSTVLIRSKRCKTV
jgi:hypothetical protein